MLHIFNNNGKYHSNYHLDPIFWLLLFLPFGTINSCICYLCFSSIYSLGKRKSGILFLPLCFSYYGYQWHVVWQRACPFLSCPFASFDGVQSLAYTFCSGLSHDHINQHCHASHYQPVVFGHFLSSIISLNCSELDSRPCSFSYSWSHLSCLGYELFLVVIMLEHYWRVVCPVYWYSLTN